MAVSSFQLSSLKLPNRTSSASLPRTKHITNISCRRKRQTLLPIRASSSSADTCSQVAAETADFPLQSEVEKLLDSVKWDDKGLAVAIAQNVDTGAILMQGFANREALAKTISSQKATFYSRSRSSLWTKGETSMNFINVHDIFLDCDRDSEGNENHLALTSLYSLESTIEQRKAELAAVQNGKPSWTKRLLLDEKLLCSKIREEANELCQTLEDNEDKSRTASEMADLVYHAMVLLAVKDVKVEDVLEVLRKRFSQSGIDEKNNRKSDNHADR
ncbi:Histidine biosynthesis bifunctional protein hisIE, chloroplastic [Asimina triloba]